eukprot:m.75843 g.75843  ORF g.75843 m.75843 type:complete len:123 (-) comp11858_c0_seq2:381-749(-)
MKQTTVLLASEHLISSVIYSVPASICLSEITKTITAHILKCHANNKSTQQTIYTRISAKTHTHTQTKDAINAFTLYTTLLFASETISRTAQAGGLPSHSQTALSTGRYSYQCKHQHRVVSTS